MSDSKKDIAWSITWDNNNVAWRDIVMLNSDRKITLIASFLPIFVRKTIEFSSGSDLPLTRVNIPTIWLDISEKVSYNSLTSSYWDLLNELWSYILEIETAFEEIDKNDPWILSRFLRSINADYQTVRNKVCEKWTVDIESVRLLNYKILDELRELFIRRYDSTESKNAFASEDIDFWVRILLCYAFIKCKVLEPPL